MSFLVVIVIIIFIIIVKDGPKGGMDQLDTGG